MTYDRPYGTTCPILNISREYGEDYGNCLAAVDWMIHKRKPHASFANLRSVDFRAWRALCAWADEYSRMRKGL